MGRRFNPFLAHESRTSYEVRLSFFYGLPKNPQKIILDPQLIVPDVIGEIWGSMVLFVAHMVLTADHISHQVVVGYLVNFVYFTKKRQPLIFINLQHAN